MKRRASTREPKVACTAAGSPPFGVFETPAGDATVLAGSIAVTGWTLDNIGVQRVELWRDLQAGEVVAFATGAEGTHQVANRSEETLRVLLLSESKDLEVCGYPDSRKVMADAFLGSADEVSHMWRVEDAVDYYEGELPPGAHTE